MGSKARGFRVGGWLRLGVLACCSAGLWGQGAGPGAPAPGLPCGGTPFPAYPALGAAPILVAWDPADLGRTWVPPPCTRWAVPGFTSLVALTARFRAGSGAAGLLRRLGAISELTGMRYWSTSGKRWKTLVVQSSALDGPAGVHARKDFTPEELSAGSVLYYQQEDNLSGKAVYRMRILSADPDNLAFDTENVTTLRYLMWPLFQPGDLQSITFLHRESPEVWRFYSLARAGRNASSLAGGHDASAENRSVAFFRHLAGIPTDQEPPGAP